MIRQTLRPDSAARTPHWLMVFLALGLLVLAGAAVHAQTGAPGEVPVEPTEPAPANAVLNAEQEAAAVKIFNELISPCCWTTTVATHGSGAAPRIQAEVRGMIARGMGEKQILDHYVAQYGERILAKPRKTGFNLAAYWVPYLAILVGGAVIVGIFRQRRKGHGGGIRQPAGGVGPSSPSPPKPAGGKDEEYRRQIEEELRRTS